MRNLRTAIHIDHESRGVGSLYSTTTLLGEGTFGKVYRAVAGPNCRPNLTEGQVVALKQIEIQNRTPQGLKDEAIEVYLWNKLGTCRPGADDCALVPVLDAYYSTDERFLWIAFKLINGIDGHEVIRRGLTEATTLKERQRFVQQYVRDLLPLISTLKRMHLLGVIHRDLKPANILYEYGTSKFYIADLGGGCGGVTLCPTMSFTIGYADPSKLIRSLKEGHEIFDERSDIYSLGMTLYSMLTLDFPHVWYAGKLPPKNMSLEESMKVASLVWPEERERQALVVQLYLRGLPKTSVYAKLLEQCRLMTAWEPKKRPSLGSVLRKVK